MLWFRKSKKGFTLIELMVVVAIIGILALLGLRVYTGQQNKAKEAIVKANAGTAQTLVQAEMADGPISSLAAAVTIATAGLMHNPFDGDHTVVSAAAAADKGAVLVTEVTAGTHYRFQGLNGLGVVFGDVLDAQR
jgi:prepilin-type N-terminal cleavage/methylation domain-containing protein